MLLLFIGLRSLNDVWKNRIHMRKNLSLTMKVCYYLDNRKSMKCPSLSLGMIYFNSDLFLLVKGGDLFFMSILLLLKGEGN